MQDRHQIKKLTDNDLVMYYKTKSEALCLAELFERYKHFVFCVAMKYLKDADASQDATMQIFLKLIDDLKLHEVKQFKPWLHTVTKNHCLMYLRSAKTMVDFDAIEKKDAIGMEFSTQLHLDSVEKENQLQSLEMAIENLDFEQRTCIDLFFIKEKSYKDVAVLTGFSMNEVKSYIQNGKRKLKLMMLKNQEFKLLLLFVMLEALHVK